MSHRRRSSNSSHSFVDSFSQDDLIDYFPRAYLTNIEKEIDIMNRIKREHQLSESGINEVGLEYVNEFRNNKQILFCIITPGTRQIPFYEFKFTFNLYIPSWRASRAFNNHRRNNRRNAYDSYQQIFLKYTFTANYQQINRIHTTIEYKMNNSGHQYFARKPYPQALTETIRKRKKYGKCTTNTTNNNNPSWTHSDLNEEMEKEQKYYKLPDLPSCRPSTSWWKRKNASTQYDLYKYSQYLQIIFNSPGLCIQDFIYDELKFPRDIKQILQQKAQFKLDALIQKTDKIHNDTINDPKKLLAREYRTKYNTQFNQNRFNSNSTRSRNIRSATSQIHSDHERPLFAHHRNRMDNITNINSLQNLDYRYHTVYIVSRPVQSPTLNMTGVNHWALKFEGINHLMTVGFFYDDESKESKILCNIIRNSKLNRRIFWYWWPRHYINNNDDDSPQFFNTNWKVIDSVYLQTMSTECIGRLINRWLTKYSGYVTATNNCQHFVRDMVSVMNIDVARKLPAFFDNKIITAIIPAAAAAGVMGEEARMLEVADMLSTEIEKYKNIIEERRERAINEMIIHSESENESENEISNKRSNSIDSNNWNECQQFVANLSDNNNGIICNEYKDVEEENNNYDINSDGHSESKDDEKQEMENITVEKEMDIHIENDIDNNREMSMSEGMKNIMNKGLTEKSELIAKRHREMVKVNDEYSKIMNMIDEEIRERGLNEQYISDNND